MTESHNNICDILTFWQPRGILLGAFSPSPIPAANDSFALLSFEARKPTGITSIGEFKPPELSVTGGGGWLRDAMSPLTNHLF